MTSDTSESGLSLPQPQCDFPSSRSVAHNSTSANKPVIRRLKKNEATAWDVDTAIRIITSGTRGGLYQQTKKYIHGLTPNQCEAVIVGFAKQSDDLEHRVEELEEEKESMRAEPNVARENERPSMRRHFTLQKIHEQYGKRKAEIAEEEIEVGPPQTLQTSLPTNIIQEKEEQEDVPAPEENTPSPPEQPAKSPTAVATPPSSQTPERKEHPAAPTPSSWRKLFTSVGGYLGGFRKRAAEEEPTAPPSEKRLRVEEPENTPVQRQTPRDIIRPSPKNPKVPTSLSTITEYTEPSSFFNVPDTTPSKPSRTPQRRTLQVPQNTPTVPSRLSEEPQSSDSLPQSMPSESQSTSNMPPPVPQSTPVNPFVVRRAAMIRAARSASADTRKPNTRQYAWEKRTSTLKPKETNADARYAKMQRMRELQKELEELKQDADVQDMEAHSVHRRKRVKIDNLAVIPHNRPGDSASTFRVPDIDSDDEMEVDDAIEERTNIFQEMEIEEERASQSKKRKARELEDEQQKAKESDMQKAKVIEEQMAKAKATPTPNLTPSTTMNEKEKEVHQAPKFTFPSVAPKPASYHVTAEYKNAAGSLFEQGFQEWLGVA